MKSITKTLFATALALSACFISSAADNDFTIKGMHIDMRTQVMSPEGLKALADKAAAGGLNTLIMEWADSFPFDHEALLRNKYSYSEEEIRNFVNYCSQKGIDVIPLQNCFGHADYILDEPRFKHLQEAADDPATICASKLEEARKIFPGIFEDVVRLHPSQYIHIGCDEVHLSCPECMALRDKIGMSKVLTDYISEMCRIVAGFGKTPVIWGDMLLHYPESIDELPEDLVIIDWHYYENPTPEQLAVIKKLMASGHKVWAGPSLRCWPDDVNTSTFVWKTHFDNIRDFIPFARKNGYDGVVMTSWSTGGHFSNFLNAYDEILFGTPFRQAFPLEGVDILQDAYAAALASAMPQDTEAFIKSYCRDKFGFNEPEQDSMVEFFLTPYNPVAASVTDKELIDRELSTALHLQGIIRGAKFRGKKADRKYYDYLKLMADTRVNYLRYSEVYCDIQTSGFTAAQRPAFAERLRPLVKEADSLAKRFSRLAGSYLKDPGYAFGDWGYVIKMKEIYLSLL